MDVLAGSGSESLEGETRRGGSRTSVETSVAKGPAKGLAAGATGQIVSAVHCVQRTCDTYDDRWRAVAEAAEN